MEGKLTVNFVLTVNWSEWCSSLHHGLQKVKQLAKITGFDC